jgi:hypothetical protein
MQTIPGDIAWLQLASRGAGEKGMLCDHEPIMKPLHQQDGRLEFTKS